MDSQTGRAAPTIPTPQYSPSRAVYRHCQTTLMGLLPPCYLGRVGSSIHSSSLRSLSGRWLTSNAASKGGARYRVDRHAKVYPPSRNSAFHSIRPACTVTPASNASPCMCDQNRGHRRTYTDPSLTLWRLIPYEWGPIMWCTAENWVTSSRNAVVVLRRSSRSYFRSGYGGRISISLSR